MQLDLHRTDTQYFIRRYQTGKITIVDTDYQQSVLLNASTLQANWPVASIAEVNETRVQEILALKPELVLLGSGEKIEFPSQKILAEFLSRGIGIEIMTNSAAARTFNVLIGEARKVVAAFIFAR